MSAEEMRELDAWIAENVSQDQAFVCWKVQKGEGITISFGYKDEAEKHLLEGLRDHPDYYAGFKVVESREFPHYTTDPAAAMGVLEKCVEKCSDESCFVAHGKFKNNSFVAAQLSVSAEVKTQAISETLPLAICLFARKLFRGNNGK